MALDFGTTAGIALRYLKGDNKISDIDAGFQTLAEDVASKMVGFVADTFAKRPAAGVINRLFKDTGTGFLALDTGTKWDAVLGPALGKPLARVTIPEAVNQEPNANRPTLVMAMAVGAFNKASSVSIEVDGIVVQGYNLGTESNSEVKAFPLVFIVPQGSKWKWFGVGTVELKASYQTL